MRSSATLPTDLRERRKLFQATFGVMELLFPAMTAPLRQPSPWEPPHLVESAVCPAFPEAREPTDDGETSSQVSLQQFVFVKVVQESNVRVAQIAQALAPLDDALLIAGLPGRDLETWQRHRTVAVEVLQDPTCLDVASSDLWFVYDCGYMGVFSTTNEDLDRKNQDKLDRCREALARLRRAVFRLDRTVNPQAVLERLRVSDDRREVILDGVSYGPFRPDGEGRFLYHLRLGAGDWVSSEDIAELEGVSQFKVRPQKDRLDKRYPRLGATIELRDGKGGRIVLPLAPESAAGR
jgi:hypothetical protein